MGRVRIRGWRGTKRTMQHPITAGLVKKIKARKQSMVHHPQVDNQETTISPTGEIVDDRMSTERAKKRCHLYLVEPMQKEDPKPKNTISTRGQIIKTDPEKTEDK
ncbi:hypothetical protein HAV15_011562 [Penicillium sp. str. |nr:hypothetical protein HAV15_011562 [Penicillium sp. str. \